MVDGQHKGVARPRVETGQQTRARAAQHSDGELRLRRPQVGVTANDRHAIGFGGRAQPVENSGGVGFAIRPKRIHHRQRPPTHRRDVGEIDHDAAPAGEPGIGGDERVEEAFNSKQQMPIPVRDRRAIVPNRNGGSGESEPFCDDADIRLRRESRACAQRARKLLEFNPVHAAFLKAT